MEYAECKYIAATAAEVRHAIMREDVGPFHSGCYSAFALLSNP